MTGTGQAFAKSYPRRLQHRRPGGDHRVVGDGTARFIAFPIGTWTVSPDPPTDLAEVYRHFAARYAALGIPVFPIRDKIPLVKHWQRMGCRAAVKFAKRATFWSAGIGMCCGTKSGITIVDVDEPGDGPLQVALARFGDTPLIVRTHSGKHHLYYRHNGERRQLGLEGKKLDILGEGGFAVLPPSSGPQDRYHFIRGGFDSLRDVGLLPAIKKGALLLPGKLDRRQRKAFTLPTLQNDVGRRDSDLFHACLKAAATAETLAQLEALALAVNSTFDPPLQTEQALQKARQAWKYKLEGRLMLPGCEPNAVIRQGEVQALIKYPVALRLLLLVRFSHSARPDKKFALGVRALSKELGCRQETVSDAIEKLINLGHIERVHRGGKCKGDASLYLLKSRHPTGAQCN